MEISREEISQEIIEKIGNLIKGMHTGMRHNRGLFGMRQKRQIPFEDLDLSNREVFFLLAVGRSKDGISVKDLAKFSNVTSGAITQLIDALITKNLVKREEDPYDRRALKIKLTDYAQERFRHFKKGYFNLIGPIFDNLTDDELHNLLNLLNKISIPEQGFCPVRH